MPFIVKSVNRLIYMIRSVFIPWRVEHPEMEVKYEYNCQCLMQNNRRDCTLMQETVYVNKMLHLPIIPNAFYITHYNCENKE